MSDVSARGYRILGSLGAGGMGEIFLAAAHGPSGFTKLVVLKTLRQEMVAAPKAHEMFLQEARVVARLNHPNVIQVYEVSSVGASPALVMEYLEGHALSSAFSRAMRRGATMPLGLGLRVVVDALRGLHYAHELRDFDGTPLGLVHRDVSPQNIVVTYDGQVKLLDFGIAKIDGSAIKTGAGEMKGKLRYMSPEQLGGRPVDRRTDVYGMGCVLWELVTGKWLWQDAGDAELVAAVMAGNIPAPRSVNPGAHPRLSAIALRAMSLDPGQRYATCVELRTEIETYLHDELHSATHESLGSYFAAEFRDLREERGRFVQTQLRAATMRAAATSIPDAAPPVPRASVEVRVPPELRGAPGAAWAASRPAGAESATPRLLYLGLAALAATLLGILISMLVLTRMKRASAHDAAANSALEPNGRAAAGGSLIPSPSTRPSARPQPHGGGLGF